VNVGLRQAGTDLHSARVWQERFRRRGFHRARERAGTAHVFLAVVDSPLTPQEQRVYDRLAALGIAYMRHEHPPVATVDEAEQHWKGIDAAHCKNLFLRNQKGTRHYLVIIRHSKKADLRAVADQIGDGKLSFASPERLMTYLGLTPGSVSPFGLINDGEHAVRVVLDRDVKSAERVSFHPNINTRTLVLSAAGFERFLEACGNPVQLVSV
jgi:Ala-tRNA(Pro) deacylase